MTTYTGTAGDDLIAPTVALGLGDVFEGLGGIDTLDFSGETIDLIIDLADGELNDWYGTVDGTISGFEVIYGGSGRDYFDNGAGAQTIYGGDNVDTFYFADFAPVSGDYFDGGTGDDVINLIGAPVNVGFYVDLYSGVFTTGGSGATIVSIEDVIGGAGNDTIIGNIAQNYLSGGGGDDIVVMSYSGLVGGESYDGGSGIDTFDFSFQTTAHFITFSPYRGAINVTAGGSNSYFSGFEVVIAGSGDDVFALEGFTRETIYGGEGRDFFGVPDNDGFGPKDNWYFADVIDGGSGLDELVYANSTVAHSYNLETGVVSSAIGGIGSGTITSVEIIRAGGGDDTLIGGAVSEGLFGGEGNDRLSLGSTALVAGEVLDGGLGDDWLDFSLQSADFYYNGDTLTTSTGDAAVFGIENVVGGSGNDTFEVAKATAERIFGGDGDDLFRIATTTQFNGDTYHGRQFVPTDDPSGGTDTLDLSALSDALLISESSVTTATGATMTFYAMDVILSGSGNDTLENYSDPVFPATLNGGDGNDLFLMQTQLVDGAHYDGGASGIDTLQMFGPLTIDLAGGTVAQNGQTATIANFDWISGSAGEDSITGTGSETLVGNDGDDWLSNAVSLDGGLGNDTLMEASGIVDSITGGDGNDLVRLGDSIDGGELISGGDGIDTLDASATSLTFGFNNSQITMQEGPPNWTVRIADVSGFEVILGGSNNDFFYGDASLRQTLDGGTGNDFLVIADRDNLLQGAAIVDGRTLRDAYIGGAGYDTFDLFNLTDDLVLDGLLGRVSLSSAMSSFALFSGMEVIRGGAGDDTLILGGDVLQMEGSAGSDHFVTGPVQILGGMSFVAEFVANPAEIDVLDMSGSSFNTAFTGGNTLNQGAGDASATGFEVMTFGNGNDTIEIVAGGTATIDAGGGTNLFRLTGTDSAIFDGHSYAASFGNATLDASSITDNLEVDLVGGTLTGDTTLAPVASIADFIAATTGDGNDTFIAGNTPTFLNGGEGSNTFFFGDALNGGRLGSATSGDGDDLFKFGAASDQFALLNGQIHAGLGIDTLDMSDVSTRQVINLGSGTPGTSGITGIDVVLTGAGNDQITGTAGLSETIDAGDGEDYVRLGLDTLDGGEEFRGNLGDDILDFSQQTTGIAYDHDTGAISQGNVAATSSGFEEVRGGAGDDTFSVTAAVGQTLRGGEGNDTFVLSGTFIPTFNSRYDGGGGIDTLDLTAFSSGVSVVLTNVSLNGVHGFEIVHSGSGNDVLRGSAANAETIFGGLGNDSIDIGVREMTDGDSFHGGDGIDTLSFWGETDGSLIDVFGGTVTDTVDGDVATFSGFEWIASGYGNDSIVLGANTLAVTINAIYGNDTLNISDYGVIDGASFRLGGVRGELDMSGLTEDVNLDMTGALNGTLTWSRDAATAFVSGVRVVRSGSGDDTLTGASFNRPETFYAGAGNDRLDGGDGADMLFGELGDDTIYGGEGDDTIHGGLGNDSLDGGSGDGDVLDYSDAVGGVTVDLANGSVSGAAGNDTVSGFEAVIGSDNADVLMGTAVTDTLEGGTGSDTLNATGGNGNLLRGGAGDDVLIGGWGSD
ncbi:hypothetical protein KUV65_14435, partial [Maritalea mobilis]|uniref:beta strand repeat-containing protein n=1 Tax=Maritalea mobilis TaxID=483324 RepID=UPI001DF34270|nr:hypothetical protein [Maritalea mobilis]